MILVKENNDKTRAVYKLADGRYRKVWSIVDEKALNHHVELLNKFMPHWVIDCGITTESMYIDTLPISGKTADTVEHTQEFIDKIYEFCLGNINTTYPYAHGDSDYRATGTIHVSTEAFPGPASTYELKTFTEDSYDSSIYNSEAVSAEASRNGNEALHTAAIYTTDFEGKVTIQGTLENQVSGLTVWADIYSTTLQSPTQPQFVNFNGVFSYIRAKYENKVSGTIDKILVKN